MTPGARAGAGLIWLASYPKSGNTWLRLALTSLKAGGQPVNINGFRLPLDAIASSRAHFDRLCDIDSSDLTSDEIQAARPHVFRRFADGLTEDAFWKTHDAFVRTPAGEALFPPDVTRGAIYMVRDPRDVALSLADHRGTSVDAAVAFMADPGATLAADSGRGFQQLPQPLLTWSQHVESWLEGPRPPPLLVRYEDMILAPADALARIASHIGWAVEPAAIAGTVQATRFDVLRAAEERVGFAERSSHSTRFFRQGRAGAWRQDLTARQAFRIEDAHGPVMRRLGYL